MPGLSGAGPERDGLHLRLGARPGGHHGRGENLETGLTRTLPVDSSGRYRVPPCRWVATKVVLERNGTEVGVRDEVAVTVAGGTQVDFAGKGEELSTIQVPANAAPAIDVSQVDTRSVFTAEQLQKLPWRAASPAWPCSPGRGPQRQLQRQWQHGAQLRRRGLIRERVLHQRLPGHQPADLDRLQHPAVRRDRPEQILTGGYRAEFGRATGGVINIVTKRGTKEWKGGIYHLGPEAPARQSAQQLLPQTGFFGDNNPDPNKRTDGKLYQLRNHNQYWTETTPGVRLRSDRARPPLHL